MQMSACTWLALYHILMNRFFFYFDKNKTRNEIKVGNGTYSDDKIIKNSDNSNKLKQ